MRSVLIRILLLFVYAGGIVFAQEKIDASDTTKFVVGQIKIFGNEITKDYVILDELPFSPGDTISNKDLQYAKERVYSLKLFNFVDFLTDRRNPRRIIILVKESWYIFPVPFIIYRKNSIKYSNYGVDLLWKNFRGRNETFYASLSFGFDPNFYASYFNPNFIARNVRLSLAGGLISVLNKSVSFKEEYAGEEFSSHSYFGTVGLGYRTSLHNTYDFFVTFRRFLLDKPYARYYFATGGTSETSVLFSLDAKWDTRNLTFNASNGYLLTLAGGYTIFFYDDNEGSKRTHGFADVSAELRNYFDINEFAIFRTKLKGRVIPFKTYLPYYDRIYLGYTKYIRGHAFDKTEGENYVLASAEFAVPIIRDFRYALDLPLIPTALTSARFVAEIVAFFDAGKTYDGALKGEIPFGYGAGLNLLFLPYNAFRFEFAWNEKGHWEFLFGTGFSF